MAESQSKQTEDLGAAEEKLDHLNKIKAKLEQTLDELEDSLQSEKKARLDLDKSRRKVEGDIKVAQEQVQINVVLRVGQDTFKKYLRYRVSQMYLGYFFPNPGWAVSRYRFG